ncbi:MAG: esterase/lipase family protein [Desulforhopalus sp.]
MPLPVFLRRTLGLLTAEFISACPLAWPAGCTMDKYSTRKPSPEHTRNECVILLHGLGRSRRSMRKMQERLTGAGYHTVNLGYPSTRKSIERAAREDLCQAIGHCTQFAPRKIHFVTHSLGGIVVRQFLKETRPKNLGRIVMLSPPNGGSEVVDRLKEWRLFKWFNGPAGQQLSTAPDSVANLLGPVDYPLGVITGNRCAFFDAWFSTLIPGADDGKVAVERAKVAGMRDFLVVSRSHPFIMNDDHVQRETVYFLNHGFFSHRGDGMETAR